MLSNSQSICIEVSKYHFTGIISYDLECFEYKHFTKEFLNMLKMELPLTITHTNERSDWESTNPSKQYETRLDHIIKRKHSTKIIYLIGWRIQEKRLVVYLGGGK